ncbi:MAG: zinc ribbon domain-containing protein [Lachnospiraceae bacterium]|nr:zinc ribbon domain-containing protein [Lachnospiraceae bacterium]
MFCNHCGAEIKDGVKFCDKCGGKVAVAQPKRENTENKVQESVPVQSATTEKQSAGTRDKQETDGDNTMVYKKLKTMRVVGWVIVIFCLLCNFCGCRGIFFLLINIVGSVLLGMGFVLMTGDYETATHYNGEISKFECIAGIVTAVFLIFSCSGGESVLYNVIIAICGWVLAGTSGFTYYKIKELL